MIFSVFTIQEKRLDIAILDKTLKNEETKNIIDIDVSADTNVTR